MIGGELGDLLGRKTGEAEHTDLVGDVVPVVRVASSLKLVICKFKRSFQQLTSIPAFNWVRMEIMRSAIPLTSPLNCSFKTGSLRIFSAIRAP